MLIFCVLALYYNHKRKIHLFISNKGCNLRTIKIIEVPEQNSMAKNSVFLVFFRVRRALFIGCQFHQGYNVLIRERERERESERVRAKREKESEKYILESTIVNLNK